MTRTLIAGLCWGFVLLGSGSLPALAADLHLCKQQFREKKFLRAAQCFQDAADKIERKKPLTDAKKWEIGQYLRNAALCLRRGAKATKNTQKKSYLREQALHLIEKMLTKKYYEASSQRRLGTVIRDKLREKIGYIQVTVTTGNANAKVQLTGGYRFQPWSTKGATISKKLRPGHYTLLVTYPKEPPQGRPLIIKARQVPVIMSFRAKAQQAGKAKTPQRRTTPKKRVVLTKKPPAPPHPSPSAAPWILLGIGGALVAGGVILVGVSGGSQGTLDQEAQKLRNKQQQTPGSVSSKDTQGLSDQHNTNNALLGIGVAAGGVGIALAAIGLTIYIIRPKPGPPPAATNATSSLLYRTW